MKNKFIRCDDCGKEFLSTHPRMTRCQVCRKAHAVEIRKAIQIRYRQNPKRNQSRSIKKAMTFQENVAAADKAGMSYGKYMASREMERKS